MKKLSEKDVIEIINILKDKSSQKQIAAYYGVSQQRISAIWKQHQGAKNNDRI